VRIVACVAAAAMLGGCLTSDPPSYSTYAKAGSWRIDRQVDRITAAPVAGASVNTQSSSNTSEIGSRPALLQLTCFENKPIAKLGFSFKIGADRNTTLGYRFDDKPGRDNVESRVLFGNQVIVIEDRAAVSQFVADLAGSSALYVRVRSLNGPRTSADFKVDGADAAIQAAYADCPLSPQPAPRRST
jgi:hypothetical protein